MPSPSYYYNAAVILDFIDEKGLTLKDVSDKFQISERHLGNILNGSSAIARRGTRKSILDGLSTLNADERVIQNAFIKF